MTLVWLLIVYSDMCDNNHHNELVISDDPMHPANLICSLCAKFYEKDWCLGTGGGISIKDPHTNHYFIAPSGVQKELMKPTDLFVVKGTANSNELNVDDVTFVRRPVGLKPSDCTPLFLTCFKELDVGAVIHTHSTNAVLASLLYDDFFEISHIEQIKAMPSDKWDANANKYVNLLFQDTLRIPIIGNKNFEYELTDDLLEVCKKYPHSCAVLVRRHGIFVWGPSIAKAKIYNESIDYLLGLAIQMRQMGLPTVKSTLTQGHK